MNHSFRAGFVEAVTTLTRAYCNSSGSVYPGTFASNDRYFTVDTDSVEPLSASPASLYGVLCRSRRILAMGALGRIEFEVVEGKPVEMFHL